MHEQDGGRGPRDDHRATPDRDLGQLARDYLDALLAWRRDDAVELIVQAARDGTDVRRLYLEVLAPVQERIGTLWSRGEVSVGVEHWCTGVTQLVLARLSPWVFGGSPRDRVAVAACVRGNLHELPLRIVTDFLELEGWGTRYLGADTPHDAVVQTVAETGADVMLVGAALEEQLDDVAQLIAQLRADERTSHVPVLVGGHVFRADTSRIRQVGADATARSADEAHAVAERLATRHP
jgi:methanogenic corrinoid protein MtbC1